MKPKTNLKVVKNDNGIRFETDANPLENTNEIHETVIEVAMAMVTTLWGGNEQAVLAMIRALAVADLGVSVNRKQMVGFLDEASEQLANSILQARQEFQESSGKVVIFAPGVPRPEGVN